jgi:SAM-dependent methyltransferase
MSLYADPSYYESHHGSDGYASYEAQEDALRRTFRRLLRELDGRGLARGRLLEVGCGYGYLLDEARPFFVEREGTDFSADAAARAALRAEHVYQGGLSAIPGDRRYDTIITNHVIEHVYEPHAFVDEMVRRLEPGGTIVVSTPNMGSPWRRVMGARWPSFKIPEHVLYFDGDSLRRVLERAGIREIRTIPYPHAFPLPLVASKLGLTIPATLARYSLWIPATTLAMAGTRAA